MGQRYAVLQLGNIIDIKVVNTDNCPEGYQALIDYYWPGIMDGCYCSAVIDNHSVDYIIDVAFS